MQHPWKPSPHGTAELGQISPGLPSCRAACEQLIASLINVNRVPGGSWRRARRPLPLLQSSFVFQQRSHEQRHNVPIKAQQAPIKNRCHAEGGQQRQLPPHLAPSGSHSDPSMTSEGQAGLSSNPMLPMGLPASITTGACQDPFCLWQGHTAVTLGTSADFLGGLVAKQGVR